MKKPTSKILYSVTNRYAPPIFQIIDNDYDDPHFDSTAPHKNNVQVSVTLPAVRSLSDESMIYEFNNGALDRMNLLVGPSLFLLVMVDGKNICSCHLAFLCVCQQWLYEVVCELRTSLM